MENEPDGKPLDQMETGDGAIMPALAASIEPSSILPAPTPPQVPPAWLKIGSAMGAVKQKLVSAMGVPPSPGEPIPLKYRVLLPLAKAAAKAERAAKTPAPPGPGRLERLRTATKTLVKSRVGRPADVVVVAGDSPADEGAAGGDAPEGLPKTLYQRGWTLVRKAVQRCCPFFLRFMDERAPALNCLSLSEENRIALKRAKNGLPPLPKSKVRCG